MKSIKYSQKKNILKQLNEQFGINKLPYLILQFGKEKLRFFSGNFLKEELIKLDNNLRIENAGLYSARQQRDGIRLTLNGIYILKAQIKKNIIVIDEKQKEQWFRGEDLDIKSDTEIFDNNFKIIKYQNEFIGCGKSTGERIINSVPKERRIKIA